MSWSVSSASLYVLDSYAFLAYLSREAGYARVRDILLAAARGAPRILTTIINLGEVLYITEREEGETVARRVLDALDSLPMTVVDAGRVITLATARVKVHHRVSYADAFAVALAQQVGATVLTADPEFRRVEHLISVEWLPSNGR